MMNGNDLAKAVKSVMEITQTELRMAMMSEVRISMEVDFTKDKIVFRTHGLTPDEKEVFRDLCEPRLTMEVCAFLSATADERILKGDLING